MKLMITGGKGMLGRTLMRRFGGLHECVGVDVDDFDITDHVAVDKALREYRPDAVIHCAAMTAVDDCESNAALAFSVNADGSANIAAACTAIAARLIAISTDYVFPGDLDHPYSEDDMPGPKSVYGASKLAGEEAVRRNCDNHVIARIAWLYGPGGPSFVHTMLRLGSQQGGPLKMVNDQVGNPTSTGAVAGGLAQLLSSSARGTFHLTCEGEATWNDFAREIFHLKGITREITPCTTSEFPRPAPRPANSRLANDALASHGLRAMPNWRNALASFFEEFPNG